MADSHSRRLQITIRYFAAARAAAGLTEEILPVVPADADGPDDPAGRLTSVGAVVALIAERHGPALTRVLPRCSYLLDEVAVHGPATPVRDGQVLDVLPPFAGG